ncbi:MAG: hypothetical protein Pg6C_04680 [Treponemataceae bacterium]|nr:MAG: hypothetical protein Pg6C_04680 [Treponemataceae bacterium]
MLHTRNGICYTRVMAVKAIQNYGESKVKTFSSLVRIKLQARMYIGGLSNGFNQSGGIYIPLKEVIDTDVRAGTPMRSDEARIAG